jgi:hypothetical protein
LINEARHLYFFFGLVLPINVFFWILQPSLQRISWQLVFAGEDILPNKKGCSQTL